MKYLVPTVVFFLFISTLMSCQTQPRESEAAGRAEAVSLTQQGMEIWKYDVPFHTSSTFEKSSALFEQALEKDSTYAMAHASLVHPYFMLGIQFPEEAEMYQAKAREAANKAMELDPELADAHYAQSLVLMMYDNNYEEGGALLQKAVELAPESAYIQREYAIYLMRMGRVEEAIPAYEKISALDPQFGVPTGGSCNAMRYAGRADEALEKWMDVEDKHSGLIQCLGMIHVFNGDYETAAMMAEEGLAADPDAMGLKGMRAYSLIRNRDFEEGIKIFDELGNKGGVFIGRALQGGVAEKRAAIDSLNTLIDGGQWGWDWQVANLYNELGDTEMALSWYEKAYASRENLPSKEALLEFVSQFKYSNDYITLREEPRMKALLEKEITS